MLGREAAAIDWLRDAFGHLKVIGVVDAVALLLDRAGIDTDTGIVAIDAGKGVNGFIAAAKNGRIWDREPNLRSPQ